MNEELQERFGLLIDRIENLNAALSLQVPPGIHVSALREALPEVHEELKAVYTALGGEDVWHTG